MRKILIVAAVAGASGVAYQWQSSEGTPKTAQHESLLKDRLWLDHVPRHDKDLVHLFVVLSPKKSHGGPRGGFAYQSQWQGSFEAFRYEKAGETMRVIFPQNGDRETLTVQASKCNEGRMDYCLEVSGSSRGVKRYYSRKGWEVKSVDEAESLAATLAP
jgi:hypothetical protein